MNVCSYHLQEAGATPEQELAYALATLAIAVLDELKPPRCTRRFPRALRSHFILCECRHPFRNRNVQNARLCGFVGRNPDRTLWRHRSTPSSVPLWGSGELTWPDRTAAENNVYRILIEMLAVTLSKKARARAVQLPAWNEALGLPRPWDQQWSMRMQQIMAFETDLLEYEDLFDGNPAVDAKVEALKEGARHELSNLEGMGGAIQSIEYMKSRLVDSNADRLNKIERNETIVVGVNKFTNGEESPLTTGDGGIMVVDPAVEADQIERLNAWREDRDEDAVRSALAALRAAAQSGDNVMEPSIAAAKAGVTTGEWAAEMRRVFGEYRGPTGVSRGVSNKTEGLDDIRDAVDAVSDKLGRRLSFLMGKPGLDGHSNGAEQIAFRARDCGMDISYEGIRLTPDQIIETARENAPHVIGLSILSGSHLPLVEEVLQKQGDAGLGHIPLIVGGIIPDEDAKRLLAMGVARVYTPKDFELNIIMSDIVTLADPEAIAAE